MEFAKAWNMRVDFTFFYFSGDDISRYSHYNSTQTPSFIDAN